MLAWTLAFALLISLFVTLKRQSSLESYRRQVFGHHYIFEKYNIRVTYDSERETLHYSKPLEGGWIQIKDLTCPLPYDEHEIGPIWLEQGHDIDSNELPPIVG